MIGNNGLIVLQQRRSLFISVYDHLQKSENTTIVTTANEREVTAHWHRTQIITQRVAYIVEMTRIFRLEY